MKLRLNCSFQPQNTGLIGFLRCIPVYDQHSNVSQITILYGMIMHKEEILGLLVVIIIIPDCLYLSYIYKSIYQWPFQKDTLTYWKPRKLMTLNGHSVSKVIHNFTIRIESLFCSYIQWGQIWLVYGYWYVCIITKEHQWCLWLSCQAEELRLLWWANHPPRFGLGQWGLTIEVQWTPQNLQQIKHSCLH